MPIIIDGNSKPAIRRAARYGNGFFPATAAGLDPTTVIQALRDEANSIGRDPAEIEVMTGCPDALPGSGKDTLAAIAASAKAGVNRIALPLSAFGQDLEDSLAAYGEAVIKPVNRT